MIAFITGANGFTGRHLTEFLTREKVQVVGLEGDVGAADRVSRQLNQVKPDWIFHLASPLIRTDQLIDDSLVTNLTTDLFGSLTLMQAAAALNPKPKILITGTNAEYKPRNSPLEESDRLEPVTAYGLSKLTQELVCKQFAQGYDLEVIQTRTFHLVGPGQRPGFVIPDLIAQISRGRVAVGNAAIERDYTDVRDAVRAYFLLIKKGQPGEVYNVCSGRTVTISAIVDKLIKLSGKKIRRERINLWRKNDPQFICGNHSKLSRVTGWQPTIDIDTSLKDSLKASRN
jgi:GDP-4-dehydro-6-deoxy-D-mannose reductase